jgi:hypothetical protein
MLCADVHFAGRYHGEVAEAMVDVEEPVYLPADLSLR